MFFTLYVVVGIMSCERIFAVDPGGAVNVSTRATYRGCRATCITCKLRFTVSQRRIRSSVCGGFVTPTVSNTVNAENRCLQLVVGWIPRSRYRRFGEGLNAETIATK